MEKKNFETMAAEFVAKCNENVNLSNAEISATEGKTSKQTGKYLDSILRGFSSTCKVLEEYANGISEAEKARKDSFYSKNRLEFVFEASRFETLCGLLGLDPKTAKKPVFVKALIKAYSPNFIDEAGHVCSVLNCASITELRKAANEASEKAANFSGAKAKRQALENEALKAWQNVDSLCAEIDAQIEVAGFRPKKGDDGRTRGALVPVARWSPAALATYIKRAAFEAKKDIDKNLKVAMNEKEADEVAKLNEASKRLKEKTA